MFSDPDYAMTSYPPDPSDEVNDDDELEMFTCQMCGGRIFIAVHETGCPVIFSHLDDTGCDDPVPLTWKVWAERQRGETMLTMFEYFQLGKLLEQMIRRTGDNCHLCPSGIYEMPTGHVSVVRPNIRLDDDWNITEEEYTILAKLVQP